MLKSELLKLIENIEDNSSIDEVLQGTDFAKSMLSLDKFKELVVTNKDFKSFLDSEKDKHSSKSLETWKANNIEKLINEEIRKRNPQKDEKDIALEELQRKIEAMEKEKQYEKLKNVALKQATEKKLPNELVDYFIGQNEETTINNLTKLEEIFNSKLETVVQERLKGSSYTPPKGGGEPTTGNPYEKGENFSLTKQMELEISNPELAKQLREQGK
ncbi:DUF4355 domain-containing protein [Clostridium botulinum]|uniref:DUF4355 domain-containing protein n=1 Tax=Clostridium botulinum TaxID=1491 RepID=UPI0013F0060F|nr:DUF4355 domain-containing protein [Clostridium botulinum]MBY6996512.1 DUF4355 domain-containing protein [Clostridium botulinum]MBY7011143.1 DUF4355 domain-containing protein [Clostridium botulinum]MCR1153625.1 DUF4355 domain-containing protein [Clostridium botulinum]MCS6165691.1 DUF4355 domain-containing protein [Clostridium botulinum]NEZ76246.1 DUF4355 domain-containing protein [Clostridium botulinum]